MKVRIIIYRRKSVGVKLGSPFEDSEEFSEVQLNKKRKGSMFLTQHSQKKTTQKRPRQNGNRVSI